MKTPIDEPGLHGAHLKSWRAWELACQLQASIERWLHAGGYRLQRRFEPAGGETPGAGMITGAPDRERTTTAPLQPIADGDWLASFKTPADLDPDDVGLRCSFEVVFDDSFGPGLRGVRVVTVFKDLREHVQQIHNQMLGLAGYDVSHALAVRGRGRWVFVRPPVGGKVVENCGAVGDCFRQRS